MSAWRPDTIGGLREQIKNVDDDAPIQVRLTDDEKCEVRFDPVEFDKHLKGGS